MRARALLRWMTAPLLVSITLSGCDAEKSEPYAGPTYHRDVAPLFQQHCLGCHKTGGVAPFALDNYETAKAYAGQIAVETAARRMPPFNVDNSGACNTYQHARWLTDIEIATFADWAKGGAVQGPQAIVADATPTPLELGHVSVTLTADREYTPDDSREDDYRCFVIAPGTGVTQYVTGFAVRPGQPPQVHHVILYSAATTEASLEADRKNEATGGTGYPCFGGAGVNATMVAGWAPGSEVTLYPRQTGIPVKGDRKLILQIHYHPQGDPKPDLTEIDLQLEDYVQHEMLIVGMSDRDMRLRPGDDDVETSSLLSLQTTVPRGGVDLLGVFPHMHKLGTKLKVEIEDGENGDQCLVDVPRWNFDWQQLFLYDKPIHIGTKGIVKLTCTYDTTSRSDTVTWGEGSDDEMCLNYFFVTSPFSL